MKDLICQKCHHALPIEDLLGAALGYSRATDSGASSCPNCSDCIEFRLRAGVVELGYTYWAGSMHFEALSSQHVAGLEVVWTHGILTATVGNRIFLLEPPRSAQAR